MVWQVGESHNLNYFPSTATYLLFLFAKAQARGPLLNNYA